MRMHFLYVGHKRKQEVRGVNAVTETPQSRLAFAVA
jgi:hypothetical protein